MIVINYIKPYIIISANYLMTGFINIYIGNQIIKKIKVQNKSTINIENVWQTHKTIKVEIENQKENTHKTINL